MKFVFLMGPTASGKTEWALALAKKYEGVVFNADSIQCYRDLDIGSAKPALAERQGIPHYLFDICEFPSVLTAGDYHRQFYAQLENLKGKHSLIFVVGGTGFYFQAIEKGLFEAPPASPELRQELEGLISAGGATALHSELRAKDPEAALKISLNDHYRIIRAIEIIRTTGVTPTELLQRQMKKAFGFPVLKLGLDLSRVEFEQRVRKRTEAMLHQGLIGEVEVMLKKGAEAWPPLQSVGYKQVLQYLQGTLAKDQLIDEICLRTMQLIKKQKTWFKRDLQINWFDPSSRILAEKLTEGFLQANLK